MLAPGPGPGFLLSLLDCDLFTPFSVSVPVPAPVDTASGGAVEALAVPLALAAGTGAEGAEVISIGWATTTDGKGSVLGGSALRGFMLSLVMGTTMLRGSVMVGGICCPLLKVCWIVTVPAGMMSESWSELGLEEEWFWFWELELEFEGIRERMKEGMMGIGLFFWMGLAWGVGIGLERGRPRLAEIEVYRAVQ